MAYFTKYEVVEPSTEEELDILFKEVLEKLVYEIKYIIHDSFCTKWYMHEEDLKDFTKTHPNIVVKIHGSSEQTDIEGLDIWQKNVQKWANDFS